jgi:hypothetical protein
MQTIATGESSMLLQSLLWQSPETLSAGTLPVRATCFSFSTEAEAL